MEARKKNIFNFLNSKKYTKQKEVKDNKSQNLSDSLNPASNNLNNSFNKINSEINPSDNNIKNEMVNDKFKDTGIPNEKINTETLEESDRKINNNTNEESINILKDELIKSIWKEKNDAVKYEIPKDIFILKKNRCFW